MIPALAASAAVLCLLAGLRRTPVILPRELARLSTMESRDVQLAARRRLAWWERAVASVIRSLAAWADPRWAGMSTIDLQRAGFDTTRFGLPEVIAIKVFAAAAMAIVVLFAASMVPPLLVLLPVASFIAFITPSLVVKRRRRHRRQRMLRELPDLIALLKAFVTAGIPLEQALHLISAQQAAVQPPNLLATEIRKALGDYGLGVTIDVALDAMAHRVGLEEIETLASALSQGKRQGTGMERILADQEAVIRMQSRNRLAAEASRVGTRLVGVLVLIYLPEFMVLIMIPLFYGIFLHAFG